MKLLVSVLPRRLTEAPLSPKNNRYILVKVRQSMYIIGPQGLYSVMDMRRFHLKPSVEVILLIKIQ